ncbi:MAG: hypothetical protein ACR2OU_04335 [Thermomicrobiales bacterium]
MNATMRRIEELERTQEWFTAFAGIEKVLAWAIETNQCTVSEAAGHLEQMKAAVPLAQFVAGNWRPWHVDPDAAEATDEMMTTFLAWEREQESARLTPGQRSMYAQWDTPGIAP